MSDAQTKAVLCERCSGTGRDPNATSVQCWKCRGNGAVVIQSATLPAMEAEAVAWQNIARPYSILTPEQYGMRLPAAEGRFRPLFASASQVPDMVLVPREPTKAMMDAVSGMTVSGPYLSANDARDIWDAMVAAL